MTESTEPRAEFHGHPLGLYVCFFTEMWERFSFYGMKALLFLYLTKYHLFGDAPAYDLLGAYGGLVYAVPVVGGMLADRYLGMRKAVVFGGVLLVLGHIGMAVEGDAAQARAGVVMRDERALQIFYFSLSLIVVGVGFLKPNISTIVGRLYPEQDPRRDSGFSIFYAGINVGALLASLICAKLGETYGWRYGFGAAGLGMVLGLVTFLIFQRFLYGQADPPVPERLRTRVWGGLTLEQFIYLGASLAVLVVWQLIQRTWTVHSAMHLTSFAFAVWFIWFLRVRCDRKQRQQMLALAVIILACLVFFSLYEQTYGSWVAFTDRMMSKQLLGFEMTASSLTFLGAAFIVLLSPVFAWLWPFLEARGWNPSKPLKSAIGLMFGGLAFIPLWLAAQGVADSGEMAPVSALVLAYFVLELGEMCLSPIGLAAVTQLSVKQVVSVMMGAWFLATAYSEIIASGFGKLTSSDGPGGEAIATAAARYADSFRLMFFIGLGAAVAFLMVAPITRRWMHGVR
jgi:POT family proton-dependent oligopeptide transporter